MKKRILMALVCIPLLAFTAGCPDYSHLRPVPDYENMTDGGGELEETETEQ